MPKTPLTDAMRDSHRITCGLHLDAASRAITEGNWTGAVLAYQLALAHANAIGDRELKTIVFGALNHARAIVKLSVKADETEAA